MAAMMRLVCVLSMLELAACGPSTVYRSDKRFPTRSRECGLAYLSAIASDWQKKYDHVATIRLDAPATSITAELKAKWGPAACRMGGELVTLSDGKAPGAQGAAATLLVLRLREAGAESETVAAAAPAFEPAASSAEPTAGAAATTAAASATASSTTAVASTSGNRSSPSRANARTPLASSDAPAADMTRVLPVPRATAAAARAGFGLRFAWPLPARVFVTETTEVQGHTATIRYDVVLSRSGMGDWLELRFDAVRLVALDGSDVTSGARADVTPTLAAALTMPTIKLAPTGELIDVVGVEDAAKRAIYALGITEPSARVAVEKALLDPAMLPVLRQKAADFWRASVESWIGLSLQPKESLHFGAPIATAGGEVVTTPASIRHMGTAKEYPGRIELSLMANGSNDGATRQIETVPRVRAVIDPTTLEPVYVSLETIAMVQGGASSAAALRRSTWEFDW